MAYKYREPDKKARAKILEQIEGAEGNLVDLIIAYVKTSYDIGYYDAKEESASAAGSSGEAQQT